MPQSPSLHPATPGQGVTGSRLPSLDGWRAIAILLVLASHSVFAAGFPFRSLGPAGFIINGEFGVRIFFVISGFIITFLLAAEGERFGRISLVKFYVRRACRILPIYLGYLLVLAVFVVAGWCRESSSSWLGCLTFTRNILGRGDSPTVHFWSLAIEEQFYLLWPFFFTRAGLWRKPTVAYSCLGAVLLVCPAIRSDCFGFDIAWVARVVGPRSLLRYADFLAVGCAFALFARHRPATPQTHSVAWPLGIAIVLSCQWQLCTQENSRLVAAFVPLLQAICLGGLIYLSTAGTGRVGALLNHPWIARIGVLSYSLYVWHMLFLSDFIGPAWQDLPTHHWAVWWIGASLVAVLSFRFLETPFLRLRRLFSADMRASPPPSSSASR